MPDLESPAAIAGFVLTIYNWGAVCILLLLLLLIARFYERKSGQRSYYAAFLLAIVLFIFAAYRYLAVTPAITGDTPGDLARFLGGVILGIFSLLLLKYMMGGRR
ncbi:MAG: hypothetical protein JXM69_05665 [Anaerolineae bacterium]|nr:hypothetical protein [Anaerolineae bacterium]